MEMEDLSWSDVLLPAPQHGSVPEGFQPLQIESVESFLCGRHANIVTAALGGRVQTVREVSDGNLNHVFEVEGAEPDQRICIKQALPYMRMNQDFKMACQRIYFEHASLQVFARIAARHPSACPIVPRVLAFDEHYACVLMEYLPAPFEVLRPALARGAKPRGLGALAGEALANLLFATSVWGLDASERRRLIEYFAGNDDLCVATEEAFFTSPFVENPTFPSRWTSPALDDQVRTIRHDADLLLAVADLKARFTSHAECLLHGDLHTGSILVSLDHLGGINAGPDRLRFFDSEFALMGPMAFDVGTFMGNLIISACAHKSGFALAELREFWLAFAMALQEQWTAERRNILQNSRLAGNKEKGRISMYLPDENVPPQFALRSLLRDVCIDAMGFAAVELVRRTIGVAHVEDFERMQDDSTRAQAESAALRIAQVILRDRRLFLVARFPRLGTCKTRLAATIGQVTALDFARACIGDLVTELGSARLEEALHASVRRVILFSPAEDRDEYRAWLDAHWPAESSKWDLESMPATADPDVRLGKLGSALGAALESADTDAVAFVGMDTPHLGVDQLCEALAVPLRDPHQAFLAPALDGGYALLAVPGALGKPAFFDVAWSTGAAFATQLAAVMRCDVQVQLRNTEELAERMQKLVTFAERQLRRAKFRAELATERAATSKEECDDTMVSMRVLREEHAQLRQQANDYANVIQRISDNSAQELEWSIAASSDAALDDALSNLEQEQRRKVKSLRDLDKLVAKLGMDHLQALSNNNFRLQMPSAEVACATDATAPPSALEALAEARGRVSHGGPDLDPPVAIPKRWRIGWNIPFALRQQMSTFQVNKRVLQIGLARKHIYSIYASRNNPIKTSGGKDGALNQSKYSSTRSAQGSNIAASTSVSLSICTHQFFSNLYGLDKLTDWHVTELLNSVQQHSLDPRVAVFGYLIRMIREDAFCKTRSGPKLLPVGTSSSSEARGALSRMATKKTRSWTRKALTSEEIEQISFDRDDPAAVAFLFDLLDKVAEIGEIGTSALQPSEDDRPVLPRTLALQIASAHMQQWKVVNAADILRAIGSIIPVDPNSGNFGGALGTPAAKSRAKGKGFAAKDLSTSLPPAEASTPLDNYSDNTNDTVSETSTISRGDADSIAYVDLDEVLLIILQGWVAHERSWQGRLRDVFLTYCTVKKFSYGGVQTCTELSKADVAARKAVLEADENKNQGYFTVMDVAGFREAIRALGSTANKRQAATLFTTARNGLATRRKIRSDAVWIKSASTRPEDKGRPYYINQLSNERVWDERPLFDTEIDEIMSANVDLEIDLDTFVRISIQNRWDTAAR
ncbi:Methylthioribose kinase [Hondaea fermentalgiana]|uniref:S-methyl-5-thioribose kinase n=1 Tax=Hondaea fermentalgiana TaxID=2315210 RepID=A0A2R5GUD0_9STRA|nr:Methylthioribose kinase [Hondaea fermentalgiana]|eukprot:GBG34165.1 Methylthioribose kinase [Hondaea fermentalgiana]